MEIFQVLVWTNFVVIPNTLGLLLSVVIAEPTLEVSVTGAIQIGVGKYVIYSFSPFLFPEQGPPSILCVAKDAPVGSQLKISRDGENDLPASVSSTLRIPISPLLNDDVNLFTCRLNVSGQLNFTTELSVEINTWDSARYDDNIHCSSSVGASTIVGERATLNCRSMQVPTFSPTFGKYALSWKELPSTDVTTGPWLTSEVNVTIPQELIVSETCELNNSSETVDKCDVNVAVSKALTVSVDPSTFSLNDDIITFNCSTYPPSNEIRWNITSDKDFSTGLFYRNVTVSQFMGMSVLKIPKNVIARTSIHTIECYATRAGVTSKATSRRRGILMTPSYRREQMTSASPSPRYSSPMIPSMENISSSTRVPTISHFTRSNESRIKGSTLIVSITIPLAAIILISLVIFTFLLRSKFISIYHKSNSSSFPTGADVVVNSAYQSYEDYQEYNPPSTAPPVDYCYIDKSAIQTR
ncbi:hypothetical protein HOLleu_28050 [Holothuria leucospilota]|uniref:Uncharacterized protein n=1 Tax=Holothuria leucospilota TaxID=206669 RepID=A0A9Q1BRB6_HOLLE|nr:hypothetical protein HOLleu_28050 [Holothuria leucospilota]